MNSNPNIIRVIPITVICLAALVTISCQQPAPLEDQVKNRAEKEAALNRWAALARADQNITLPVLLKAANDKNDSIRRLAARKLPRFARTNDNALKALARLVTDDSSPAVRTAAVQSLGALGNPSGAPALVTALCDDHQAVRLQAWKAILKMNNASADALLGMLSPKQNAAKKTCRRHDKDGTYTVAKEVHTRLEQMGPKALDVLVKGITFPDTDVATTALTLLGKMGSAAVPQMDKIVDALNQDNPTVQLAAILAISRIGDRHPLVMPTLYAHRSDPNPLVAKKATEAIELLQNAWKQAQQNRLRQDQKPGPRRGPHRSAHRQS